jgi:hypothetical protein
MCKSVRKSTKAAVTKLALGAFSPKPANPATAPSLPHSMSSSSWKFWPSKWTRAYAVPDLEPTLLDSYFIEPSKLQLLFRPSGKYMVSNTFHSCLHSFRLFATASHSRQNIPAVSQLHWTVATTVQDTKGTSGRGPQVLHCWQNQQLCQHFRHFASSPNCY